MGFLPLENSCDLKYLISENKALCALSIPTTGYFSFPVVVASDCNS